MTHEQNPQTLEEWRVTWNAADLHWLPSYQARIDRRDEERDKRRRARARRDRTFYGEDFWVEQQPSGDSKWLQKVDLPQLPSETALADFLGLSLSRLRWFTHDKPVESVWHYYTFKLPKRRGGTRTIIAPKAELKDIQRAILANLLEKFPASKSAHGFIKDRSIVTNAAPHVGKQYILKLDLQDFFPSITVRRAQRFFAQMYPSAVAAALALLLTEYAREMVEWHDETFFVSVGERHLVQGAPTSPMMANILARRLDVRLTALAEARGFTYTRYADDLTFSGDNWDGLLRILDVAQRIIADEGFAVNKDKTSIKRRSSRQIVTGVVVNDGLSSPREIRRKVRAILHRARHTGLAAQNREGRSDFRAYLQGLIGYLHDVNPDQAARFLAQLKQIPD